MTRSLSFLVLLSGLFRATTAHVVFDMDELYHAVVLGSSGTSWPADRLLQEEATRSCNELIGVVDKEAIIGLMSIYYSAIFQSNTDALQAQLQALTSLVKYDTQVWKLCASCQELEATTNIPGVCDPDVYGYDAQHSSLVFVPIDAENEAPLPGLLRGFYTFRGTRATAQNAPTDIWPASLGETLATTSTERYPVLLAELLLGMPGALASSLGSISIVPDFLGYGASLATHNRTFAIQQLYQQAAAVSYEGTKATIKELTGGCTQLSDTVSLLGISEGGYAAVASALTLREMDVRILKLFAVGALLDPETVISKAVESYDNGEVSPEKSNILYQFLLPFSGFSYSLDLPGMANAGTGQIGLSPNWTNPDEFERNVIAWLESPDPLKAEEVIQLAPPFAPDTLNPDLLQLLRDARAANVTHPCESDLVVEGLTDKLCEAILQNDITDDMALIDFPTDICFSPDDTIIHPDQFEDAIVFANSFVKNNSQLFGQPIRGDHGQAIFSCTYHVFGFLVGADQPTEPDLQPTLVEPLLDPAECLADLSPTLAPTPTISQPTGAAPTAEQPPTPAGGGDDSSAFSLLTGGFYLTMMVVVKLCFF